jgi:hypothetical protein
MTTLLGLPWCAILPSAAASPVDAPAAGSQTRECCVRSSRAAAILAGSGLSQTVSGNQPGRAEPAPAAPPGMVWIPGGEFSMGSTDPLARPDESPVHRVRVDGFWMDATELTNADFRAFVRQREREHWIGGALAVLVTIIIVIEFLVDSTINTASPPQIIYVEQWKTTRTDAEIIADQKKRQAEKEAAAKERQRQFQKLEKQLGM